LASYKSTLEYSKYIKKEQELKEKEVEKILFEKYIRIQTNKKLNNTMISSFFN
jgi:hypothetical protein